MMKNFLGEKIYDYRVRENMTQDQLGARYGVSGPAIFKFEKSYVRPSLALWMRMSRDFKIPEKKAVLLWVKSKLPDEYQDCIDLRGTGAAESQGAYAGEGRKVAYAQIHDRDELRATLLRDATIPRGLKGLIKDDELWGLYKPTGREVALLRDSFGKLGEASKNTYREALRIVRDFLGTE